MTLKNALGAHVQVIVPEGYMRWHDEGYLIEKLDEYSWSLELDTHVLHDDTLRVDFFKRIMRKVYWDLGIESVSDEVLTKFLEEGGWQ